MNGTTDGYDDGMDPGPGQGADERRGRGPAGPFFDGLARLIAEGAGAADGVRREAETVIHSQLQRFTAEMDLVPREEFEAVKETATRALDEVERLRGEVEALRTGSVDALRAGGSPQPVDD